MITNHIAIFQNQMAQLQSALQSSIDPRATGAETDIESLASTILCFFRLHHAQ